MDCILIKDFPYLINHPIPYLFLEVKRTNSISFYILIRFQKDFYYYYKAIISFTYL